MTKHVPRCHREKGKSYHSIVLRRYSSVRATGIITEDTCSKYITGPIIVQQGCDRLNDIKAERTNVWPYSKAMTSPIIVLCIYGPITGPIVVLRIYGPIQATQIMDEVTCNKNVTGQMT